METIATELNDISEVERLGLALGIRMSELDKIMADYSKLEMQKARVVYYWLIRKGIAQPRQIERPTWKRLADAVAKLNPALSNKMRCQH